MLQALSGTARTLGRLALSAASWVPKGAVAWSDAVQETRQELRDLWRGEPEPDDGDEHISDQI